MISAPSAAIATNSGRTGVAFASFLRFLYLRFGAPVASVSLSSISSGGGIPYSASVTSSIFSAPVLRPRLRGRSGTASGSLSFG